MENRKSDQRAITKTRDETNRVGDMGDTGE